MATRDKGATNNPHDDGEVVKVGDDLVNAVTGEIVPVPTGARQGDTGIADYMRTEELSEEEEKLAAYKRIIDQILAADTPDEVLTPIEAMSLRDFVGEVITIKHVSVNKSEYDVGSPFYFTMECVNETTQETLVLNSGVQRVMAQIVRLNQLGALPCKVRIGQGKKVDRSGKFPLRLEKP